MNHAVFVWNERYETGLDVVDHQHRRLVELLNQLGALYSGAGTREELLHVFDELAAYTVYHFQTEEKLMAELNISAAHADPHRAEHAEFIRQVNAARGLVEQNTVQAMGKLLTFLTRWLTGHILGVDRRFVAEVLALWTQKSPAEAAQLADEQTADATTVLLAAMHGIYDDLAARTHEYQEANRHLQEEMAQRQRTEEQLAERVREITCLYRISTTLEQRGKSMEHILKEVVDALAEQWPWGGHVAVRLATERGRWQSAETFPDGYTCSRDVMVEGRRYGQFEIACDPASGDCAREPSAAACTLLDRLTERVAQYMEGALAQEERRKLSQAVAQSPVSIVITDRDAVIEYVNATFCDLTGYTVAEAVGQNPRMLQSGETPPGVYREMWESIRAGWQWQGELRNRKKSGELYWEFAVISAIFDEEGYITHYLAVKEDITERKKADEARDEALDRLQKIASRVPGVVFQLRLRADGSSCVPYASEAIREIYRVSPEDVHDDAAPVFAAVHPADLPAHLASIAASARDLSPWHQEYRLKFDGESDRWLQGDATPQREADGSVLWHGFITDITERKTLDEALRVAATAFESQEGMIITDPGGTILRVNRAFTEITGYAVEDAVGEKMSLLKSGRHDAAFYAAMWEGIQSTGSWQGEVWNRRKNGEVYPEWLTITAVKDDAGKITHYVGTLTDITVRKAAEDEIKHLAFYDPLTRLPNRRLLLDRMQQALASSARSGREGALLFIDLDNFKTLNDTLGHDIGDLLLQQVAQRLASCVREGDTVARLGGDEFVVMLEDLSKNPQESATQTEIVGEKILAALNLPYQLAGRQHHSTPSIGATLFNDHLNSVDELLKRADLAMYQAKAAGRNTLRFFDPEMQAVVTFRAALESDLRQGLQQNQFVLYYQSQVDGVGRVTGAEALLRWRHPQRGLVSPADFIPLAEETGLILPLGHWVLETACAQLVAWAALPDMSHLTLAVNVSARQFRHPDFVDQVLAVLDNSGAKPQKLKLELTESLVLDDVEDIIAKMTALKNKGVGFSLDDFGTGYSSLSYLKRLPLDQLKIDQSFVRDILTDANDAAIARTIVALAQSMSLAVIAEGVETGEQRDFLARQGCLAFQGYLFGRPLPAKVYDESVSAARSMTMATSAAVILGP